MSKPLKIYFAVSAVILLSITLRYLSYLYDRPNPNRVLEEVYEEEPLLLSAKLRAKENQDTLLKYFPLYPNNTFVKYPVDSQQNRIEYEWGKLLEIQDSILLVEKHKTEMELEIPLENMQDWLVEIEDNKIKGAYTTQAYFILESKINKNTKAKLDSILGHFSDPLY